MPGGPPGRASRPPRLVQEFFSTVWVKAATSGLREEDAARPRCRRAAVDARDNTDNTFVQLALPPRNRFNTH